MRIFFDTEFLDEGKGIHLISIGMVREDGAELYLENRDFRVHQADDWLRHHVLSQLSGGDTAVGQDEMAARISDFALEQGKPEFWAHYASHDWVALANIFGGVLSLPKGFPKFCMDTIVVSRHQGIPLPSQTGLPGEHHALVDARFGKAQLAALGVPFPAWDRDVDCRLPHSSMAPSL